MVSISFWVSVAGAVVPSSELELSEPEPEVLEVLEVLEPPTGWLEVMREPPSSLEGEVAGSLLPQAVTARVRATARTMQRRVRRVEDGIFIS